jgi:RNA polymerase sigma factor (sigma-70 family)
MTDSQHLLAEYRRNGLDAAFRELVARFVGLVYSTALRLVEGDVHRAEDVTQTVFADLARLARTLSNEVRLGGWLHRHTCFVAVNSLRGERRRQARERQAVEMNTLQNNSEADFSQVAPLLDEAINELGEADRTAILLRFFEQQDFRAVGLALGSNEDAARMRVTRALEKLEEFLKRRGVTTSAASLGVVLTANAVQAAPVGLAVTISTAAALTGTTIAATATATAIKTIAMTTLQKTIIGATLAAAVGAGIYEARQNSKLRDQNESLQQQTAQLKTESESLSNRLTAVGNTQSPSAKSLPDEQYNELLRLRGMAGVARRAIGEAEQLRAQLARQASEATNNPISGTMVDAIKQRAEQQMEGRFSRMTASLHLTAEQAQAARDILMRQERIKSAVMQQGQSGKLDMKEITRQAIEAGDPDEQIKALLTPDQRAAFPAYRQEEAAHNASLTANQELLNMQSTLGLTAEQTDRVYAALYEVSFNQLTGRTQPPSTNPRVLDDPLAAQAEAQQWTLNQKTKALESVLTPTQLENYRQQQALQAKLVKEMLDKMQGSTNAK